MSTNRHKNDAFNLVTLDWTRKEPGSSYRPFSEKDFGTGVGAQKDTYLLVELPSPGCPARSKVPPRKVTGRKDETGHPTPVTVPIPPALERDAELEGKVVGPSTLHGAVVAVEPTS